MRTAVVVTAGVFVGLLATLLLLVVDARGMLLDTDQWTDATAVVIEDDEARAALATLLVDRGVHRATCGNTIASLVADSRLGDRLQARLATEVDDLLASDRASRLWRSTNRTAHAAFVDAARTDRPVGDDRLLEIGTMLDRAAIVADLLDIEFPFGSDDPACSDDEVQVLDADSLRRASDVARTMHDARWIPYAITGALVAAALILLVAAGSISRLGIGLAVAGLTGTGAALAARAAVVGDAPRVVDDIHDAPARELAGAVVEAALAPTAEHLVWFATGAGVVAVVGVIVVLVRSVQGRTSGR